MANKTTSEEVNAILGNNTVPQYQTNATPTSAQTTDVASHIASSSVDKKEGFGTEDISDIVFSSLFGDSWGEHFEGTIFNNIFFSQLFEVLSYSILTLVTLSFIYIAIISAVNTAKDGSFLGKRHSSFWAPFRLVLALLLIMPVHGGFSLAQTWFLSMVIKPSVTTSNKLAATGVDMLIVGVPMIKVQEKDPTLQLSNMYRQEVCLAALAQHDNIQADRIALISNIKIKDTYKGENDRTRFTQYDWINKGDVRDFALASCTDHMPLKYALQDILSHAFTNKPVDAHEACYNNIYRELNTKEETKYGITSNDPINEHVCGSWRISCPAEVVLPNGEVGTMQEQVQNIKAQECKRRALAYMKTAEELRDLAVKQVSLANPSQGENDHNSSIYGLSRNCKSIGKPANANNLAEYKFSEFNKIICQHNENVRKGNFEFFAGSGTTSGTSQKAANAQLVLEKLKPLKAAELEAIKDSIKKSGFMALVQYYFTINDINRKIASSTEVELDFVEAFNISVSDYDTIVSPEINKANKYLRHNTGLIEKTKATEAQDAWRFAIINLDPTAPLTSLVEFGVSTLRWSTNLMGAGAIVDGLTIFMKSNPIGWGISALASLLAGILFVFGLIMFIPALIMTYSTAAIPILNWTTAFVGWIMSVFAVMLGIPFWLMGAMFPDGDSFINSQHLKNGIGTIIAVGIKPISMVIGFWFAYIFSSAGVSLAIVIMKPFLLGLSESVVYSKSIGYISLYLSACLMTVVIFGVIIFTIVNRAHSAYYKLDDLIMRGLGFAGLNYAEEVDERNSTQIFSAVHRRAFIGSNIAVNSSKTGG